MENITFFEQNRLLTQKETATFLQCSQRTLENWRNRGIGPNIIKTGKNVRYRVKDLEAWLEANTIVAGE